MSGVALILDLLRKNPSFHSTHTLQSHGLFCASAAASAAAASSVAAGTPFASRFLFGDYRNRVAYCDVGAAFSDPTEDTASSFEIRNAEFKPSTYIPKEYRIELKPLFSAFEIRAFALTSLRSFLLYYLPLLEPHTEEDDDFLQDTQEEQHVDLVVPFKKSVKQIIRETTVVTTRRVLERLAVIYVSQRMAWKLLKDVPKSAIRKSQRRLPSLVYMWRVSRTTFRGHLLGVAASWIVQVGIDTYRFLSSIFSPSSELEEVEPSKQAKILGKKVFGTTIRCGASLVFASVGAGLGAAILRPSLGQWIGCAVGDLGGPIIVTVCLEKFLHVEL
ncbi:uncharacterized protein LOC116215243 [Punica granatum]|uniref:Uncharacterized protein n=2 Tax=Punica granatum TaxID=22663 RepID=A0A2I0L9Z0_PUNGR|nr:uncharacterized protein LOC116215243 [Punica granatum]PKI77504.1 hypothetical protein CRG98_002110 [Punica granatum]